MANAGNRVSYLKKTIDQLTKINSKYKLVDDVYMAFSNVGHLSIGLTRLHRSNRRWLHHQVVLVAHGRVDSVGGHGRDPDLLAHVREGLDVTRDGRVVSELDAG